MGTGNFSYEFKRDAVHVADRWHWLENASSAFLSAVQQSMPAIRKPRMLVAIALANKMARMVWAMLSRNEDYKDPAGAVS